MHTQEQHRTARPTATPGYTWARRSAGTLACSRMVPTFAILHTMRKAYWISCYRLITDPAKLAAYAKLAGPAIEGGGGKFLARTSASMAYEDGRLERTVIIEFDSVEQAVAVHDSAAYQTALAALGDGAVRDMRIVAGI
jgi:uncharacterized protein (DUF1330 family)